MLVDMTVLQQNLANFTQTAQLTSLLAGKVDNSRVLTDVPSGAVFTDTLYVHPSQHSISMITGLQTELNGKQPLSTIKYNRPGMVSGQFQTAQSPIDEIVYNDFTVYEALTGTNTRQLTIEAPTKQDVRFLL